MAMPSSVGEPTSILTGDRMRRVAVGTKIKVPTEIGIDYATILEYQPSKYEKDMYLVKWGDGSQTLLHLKKENLIKNDRKTTKKKTT